MEESARPSLGDSGTERAVLPTNTTKGLQRRSTPTKEHDVTVSIYLESAEENFIPELALEADHVLPGTWNGWAQPVATATAMGDFLGRWRANDPNGDWGYVTEVGDTLISTREDTDSPDLYPKVGENHQGEALYDLSGMVWVVPGTWGTPPA